MDLNSAQEAAIAAQFALFAVVALLKAREGAGALYFLAAVTGLVAFMLGGNLLAAVEPGFGWVNIANLGMELLVGPATYLYVRQARPDPALLTLGDGLHAAPALVGLVFLSAAGGWLDVYVVGVTLSYFMASGWRLWHGRANYPVPFQRFSGVLIVLLTVAGALRVAIATDPAVATGFRDTAAYTALLGIVLAAAWFVLFAALRWPDVVSAAAPARKYALSGAGQRELAVLRERMAAVLKEERPYLDADLTLDDMALRLCAAPRHVSQLINSEYGMNFSAYMNRLRAELAAQKLATEPAAMPIKTIMYDSGFRSKSVFNREFRRFYRLTPSEYRRNAAVESLGREGAGDGR